MNRGVPSQIPRVLLAISLVLLVCLPEISHADRACCRRTEGCNLRSDCTCRILEITCTDPSLGLQNYGKRSPARSPTYYDSYTPILERIAELASLQQDDRWKRKRSSSSNSRYPFYDFNMRPFWHWYMLFFSFNFFFCVALYIRKKCKLELRYYFLIEHLLEKYDLMCQAIF